MIHSSTEEIQFPKTQEEFKKLFEKTQKKYQFIIKHDQIRPVLLDDAIQTDAIGLLVIGLLGFDNAMLALDDNNKREEFMEKLQLRTDLFLELEFCDSLEALDRIFQNKEFF